MQEIEFTKEDEYCIRNFGYNTVGDYEDLKQLEDKEHLIIEELEYRLQQKENIIREVREMLYKRDKDDYDIYTANVLCDIQSDFEEILRGEY